MRLIRFAIVLGLLCALPICALIYVSVDRLEKNVTRDDGSMGDALHEIGDFYKIAQETAEGVAPESASPEIGAPATRRPAGFPFSHTLQNQARRSLEVIVVGRAGETLQFLSLRDNRHYQYPIAGLCEEDRAFCESLPSVGITPDDYPVARLLTDIQGRRVTALIDGRSQFEVVFRDFESGRRHTFPINRLSAPDRAFVFGLPIDRDTINGLERTAGPKLSTSLLRKS